MNSEENHKNVGNTIKTVVMDIINRYRDYDPLEVLKLMGYTHFKSNLNMVKSSKNEVSLKLFTSLMYLFSINASYSSRRIGNYEKEYDFIVQKLDTIYNLYFNKVFEDSKITPYDEISSRVFLAYHFDYHLITTRQYKMFFEVNSDIIGEIYKSDGLSANEIIRGLCALLKIDHIVADNKQLQILHNYYVKYREDIYAIINNQFFYLIIPIEIAKRILAHYQISENLITRFFKEVQRTDQITFLYPTDINTKYLNDTVGLRYNEFLFIPKTYYFFDRIYNYILNSKKFKGCKGYKGKATERYCISIINKIFNSEDIYSGLYDEEKTEQDIIVKHGEYILVFECKSSYLREPFRDNEKSMTRLKVDFKESIQDAFEQANRVRNKIMNKTAYYYSSNKEDRKLVLDLNSYSYNNVILITVTLTTYLTLASDLHLLIQKNVSDTLPWAIDIFSLEHIINKCEKEHDAHFFITYIQERIKTYGSTVSSTSDELTYFGFYERYGRFYNGAKYNASMMLGGGYSTFVIDEYEENHKVIDNLLFLPNFNK